MRLTARKPTEAELAEAKANKPVYKVVRVVNGRLKSLWVTGTRKHPQYEIVGEVSVMAFALTYAEGQLSGNGELGIWCCKTLASARQQAQGNGYGQLCGIFLAYPLGQAQESPLNWGDYGTVLYPSIILGRKIRTMDRRGK